MEAKLLIFLQLATFLALCTGKSIVPKSLVNLGQINGKLFFYDKSTKMNRAAASTFCVAGGMQLAEVATVAEEDFLKGKYAAGAFDGSFWTDGVDARAPHQFKWATSGNQMGNTLRWYSFADIATCVLYLATSSPSTNGVLQSYPCSYSTFPLCQAK